MSVLRSASTNFALLFLFATALSAQDFEGALVSERPDLPGVPTRVGVTLVFLDLVEIDDVAQEYTADIFFRVEWLDQRLALADETASERIVPLSDVWWPQLVALNRRTAQTLLPQVVHVDAAGNAFYDQRFYGVLSARLDLREFPGDQQTLPVQILSFRYSPEEVELEVQALSRAEELSLTGWTIEGESSEVAPKTVAGSEREFAGVIFRIEAKREVSYYLWTMGLPLLLICVMAWTVFWIDPSLLPSQLAISTASVFSLIAFRFSIKLSLPKVSYLTVADGFILVATVLVFGALGQAVMTGRLAKSGREDAARAADRWGRWIYLAVLLVLAGWLVI